MHIPQDALIARAKLTQYLLVFKEADDKSGFLQQAGFTLENADDLEYALREHIRLNEAVFDRENEFGKFYEVAGQLIGPNDRWLDVVTIWLLDNKSQFRFITLKPRRD